MIANDPNPQQPDQALYYFEDECDAVTCAQTIASEASWAQLGIFWRSEGGEWELHLHSVDGKSWLPPADMASDGPPSYALSEYAQLRQVVQEEYDRCAAHQAQLTRCRLGEQWHHRDEFRLMRFDELEAGDVLLQNTNGPQAWVGRLMGMQSAAGRLGMTHACMVYKEWYGGVPERCLLWEM